MGVSEQKREMGRESMPGEHWAVQRIPAPRQSRAGVWLRRSSKRAKWKGSLEFSKRMVEMM